MTFLHMDYSKGIKVEIKQESFFMSSNLMILLNNMKKNNCHIETK